MSDSTSTAVVVPDSVTIDGTTFHFKFKDLLPPLSWAEQASQRNHIKQHGIKVAVLLVERPDGDFDVVDGINRLMNAAELGLSLDDIPRDVQVLDEDAQEDLALSLNFERRQLTPQQRQAIVKRLHERGQSQRAIAEKLGTSAATVNRDLKAAGVSDETPDDATVTGRDGKQYPAVSETTRQQQDAAAIMDLFYERRKSTLEIDDIRRYAGIPTEERLVKALNYLGAAKLLAKNGFLYYRIFDNGPDLEHWCGAAPQVQAAILETLKAFGPKKSHEVCQYVNVQWGKTEPHTFDVAVKNLVAAGAIEERDKGILALAPIAHIDPETAEVTRGETAVTFSLDEAQRIAEALPERQREFLIAVATGQPVVKNAATRIALVNRKLLHSAYGTDSQEWWDQLELTEGGIAVAAVLTAAEAAQGETTPSVHDLVNKIVATLQRHGRMTYPQIKASTGDPDSDTLRRALDTLFGEKRLKKEDGFYSLTQESGDDTSPLSGLTGEGGQGGEVSDAILAMMIKHLPGRGPKHAISEPNLRNWVTQLLNRKITTLLVHLDALERDGQVGKNGLGLYYLPAESDEEEPHDATSGREGADSGTQGDGEETREEAPDGTEQSSLSDSERAAIIARDNAAAADREARNAQTLTQWQHRNEVLDGLHVLTQIAHSLTNTTRSITAWAEHESAEQIEDLRAQVMRAAEALDGLLPDLDAKLLSIARRDMHDADADDAIIAHLIAEILALLADGPATEADIERAVTCITGRHLYAYRYIQAAYEQLKRDPRVATELVSRRGGHHLKFSLVEQQSQGVPTAR